MKFVSSLFIFLSFCSVKFPFAQNAPAIEWEKSLGGSYDEIGNSGQQTHDGGYIVAGDAISNNGDVSGHHGYTYDYYDYWIVKLDSSGEIMW